MADSFSSHAEDIGVKDVECDDEKRAGPIKASRNNASVNTGPSFAASLGTECNERGWLSCASQPEFATAVMSDEHVSDLAVRELLLQRMLFPTAVWRGAAQGRGATWALTSWAQAKAKATVAPLQQPMGVSTSCREQRLASCALTLSWASFLSWATELELRC